MINKILTVHSANPDDARRRRLLNILLVSLVPIVVLGLIGTVIADITDLEPTAYRIYQSGLATLIGIGLIFLINRYFSGEWAGALFLLVLVIAVSFDNPEEVVLGRSLFMYVIPILMASVLLRPYASFIAAGLITILLAVIAVRAELVPNFIASLAFFAIATVSWLAALSLERALEELRILNEKLEQRVIERTRELAEASGKNQAILASIADGVIVFDNEGKAIVANPAVNLLLGQPSEAILGHSIEELMGENVDAADQAKITTLLKDKDKPHSGLKFEWSSKTLSVSSAPVHTEPGSIAGTVTVFRDFTKEAEVDRMKSAIVSMVSHDLRTPLNVILGYAEMLQEAVYGQLSEKQFGTMERIVANAKRLLGLVNDLLDQAQMEAGRLKLTLKSFTPAELLDGIQSVMGVLAQTKGLELGGEIASDMPSTLQGDPQRLHQVVVNLVNNALKFTEQGGVQVRIYRVDMAHWAIQVSDTGSGIPPDKLDRVFERFYQVDDLTTRKHQGVGLGLAIVKQLIDLMGGQIGVKSELGKGSTFTVTLPVEPPKQEEITEEESS